MKVNIHNGYYNIDLKQFLLQLPSLKRIKIEQLLIKSSLKIPNN